MSGLLGATHLAEREAPAATVELRLTDFYQDHRQTVFDRTLEALEARGLTAEGPGPVVQETIEGVIERYAARSGMAMNASERAMLAEDVRHEIGGLGPLEPLLADPTVDDIIVNGPRRVYVERAGRLTVASVRFRDDAHLMAVIQRIVSPIGRRVDEASPYVDARLADGSRVNIVIPPVALDGPLVSIRKFKRTPMTPEDYVRAGSISDDMLGFLQDAVRSRLNLLICGGTGSGKTTLLNMLSGFIPDTDRLVTIEDAAELQLRQSHVARMETRPPTLEGGREVSARDLVKNALRMRPDRIILGEVRGAEAVEMLQAMSTGHDGSMATIHANSNRDVFSRLEMLLGFGGLNGDAGSIRRYLARSINLLVQVQRLEDGRRRVVSIAEVTGVEGEHYSLNELYSFEEDPPLSGQGGFRTHSAVPFHARRLARAQATKLGGRP